MDLPQRTQRSSNPKRVKRKGDQKNEQDMNMYSLDSDRKVDPFVICAPSRQSAAESINLPKSFWFRISHQYFGFPLRTFASFASLALKDFSRD
jgi:hypothetical protein